MIKKFNTFRVRNAIYAVPLLKKKTKHTNRTNNKFLLFPRRLLQKGHSVDLGENLVWIIQFRSIQRLKFSGSSR